MPIPNQPVHNADHLLNSASQITMNTRLIFFLLAVVAFVAALVYFERQRQDPWNSPVFFSQLTSPAAMEGSTPNQGVETTSDV